jgi:hypothetical protein
MHNNKVEFYYIWVSNDTNLAKSNTDFTNFHKFYGCKTSKFWLMGREFCGNKKELKTKKQHLANIK